MNEKGQSLRPGIVESAWAALQIAMHVALGPVLRRWRTRWGATDVEIRRALPGDELVAVPNWGYTHAITSRCFGSGADLICIKRMFRF